MQTQDLVDFALHAFFRLATGIASGNTNLGGGGGGGFLGFLGNIVGSILGPGQDTAASTGLPGVFDAGGSVALPQFHDGGQVAGGKPTRQFAASLLMGAPRPHSGGLLPGETAAILNDEERLLTLSQQQATAATITRPESGKQGGVKLGRTRYGQANRATRPHGYPTITTGLVMAPRGVGTMIAMILVGRP